MAPEMVTRGSPGYGPEADIWSCGVCLYQFLSGRLPFPGNSAAEVFNAIRHNDPDFSLPAWTGVSPSARDLLRRILVKDPAKRITAEGIHKSVWMTRYAAGSAPCVQSDIASQETVRPSTAFIGPGDAAATGRLLGSKASGLESTASES